MTEALARPLSILRHTKNTATPSTAAATVAPMAIMAHLKEGSEVVESRRIRPPPAGWVVRCRVGGWVQGGR